MCLLQLIERIERIDFIYKDREGWDLEYTKLLLDKVGDTHCFSEF